MLVATVRHIDIGLGNGIGQGLVGRIAREKRLTVAF